MTIDRVKELFKAQPFVPFTIHMADGMELPVSHSELMWITPGGRTIFVARGTNETDRIEIIDALLVTRLSTSVPNYKDGQSG